MKFVVLRSKCINQLQLICSFSSKLQFSSDSKTLLEVSNDVLKLTSSDGFSQINISIPLEYSDGDCSLAIPVKKFFDLCKILSDDAIITCNLNNDKLTITSDSFKATLQGLPSDSIVLISEFKHEIKSKIPVKTLKKIITSVQFAMAQQDVRHYLNGLLLTIDNNTLIGVTTDGHRLAYGRAENINFEGNHSVTKLLIPRKSVLEINRCLDFMDTEYCEFLYGDNTILLYNEQLTFKSQLLVSAFPSYESALDNLLPYYFDFDLVKFKQAMLRALVLISYEKPRKITISLRKGIMELITVNSQQECINESFELSSYNIDETNLSFDIKYLIDVLQVLECDTFRLSFKDYTNLVRFTSIDNNDFQYVVMPML